MHMFPQLRRLEQRFPDELVVVGVHAAKFHSEKETDSIRWALLRFGIQHPVVNDRDFRIWSAYAVRAWPTLVFVDPNGKVIGQHAGELPFEALERLVGEMIDEFDHLGILDRRKLTFVQERSPTGSLAFPGKLLVQGGRLYIADTNHHRIVVSDLQGRLEAVIGSGPGFRDGDFATAQFAGPRGVAIEEDRLYVADTENHVIRLVDLAARTVQTIAGTGEQSRGYPVGGSPLECALSSPWDLTVAKNGKIFMAMAGSHQIWMLDTWRGIVRPHAGAGPEGLQDGPLASAHLAQPSGITSDGEFLLFADSETSSIRRADFSPDGMVVTYVGKGLFDFGDVDGIGEQVRLQHPLGVHLDGKHAYIADSFNHKVKSLDLETLEVRTIAGDGEPGLRDGPALSARFNEPEGLWIWEGKLYLADTNNHVVRVLDLSASEVSTMVVS